MRKPKPFKGKQEVDSEVVVVIEFICPVRGLVSQEVKGIKLKPIKYSAPKYTAEELFKDTKADEEDN